MDIAPNIGMETRRPLFPSLTYSALLPSREVFKLNGISCVGMDILSLRVPVAVCLVGARVTVCFGGEQL